MNDKSILFPQQIVTREEALQRGHTHFYIGTRCKNGHLAKRYVSNGACVDCVNPRRRYAKEHSNSFTPTRAMTFSPSQIKGNLSIPLDINMRQALTVLIEQRFLIQALNELVGAYGPSCPGAAGITTFIQLAGHTMYLAYDHHDGVKKGWRPLYPQYWAKDARISPTALIGGRLITISPQNKWVAADPTGMEDDVLVFKA
jgi:hypothetical protein